MIPMEIIATIRSDFPTKFGIPRQSGLVEELRATVVFEPEYRSPDALRGLEDFSHLWLIWQFSEAVRDKWSPTVRPPRLGGNTRMGVFATRSPFRPNPIGLSCVRLEGIRREPELGCVLEVFLARRESIWPGLALPILAGLYAVVMALSYTAAPDTPWNQVLGGVLAVFLVSGIPAFLLLMVFFICRSGRRRKKQQEKMNVQDL